MRNKAYKCSTTRNFFFYVRMLAPANRMPVCRMPHPGNRPGGPILLFRHYINNSVSRAIEKVMQRYASSTTENETVMQRLEPAEMGLKPMQWDYWLVCMNWNRTLFVSSHFINCNRTLIGEHGINWGGKLIGIFILALKKLRSQGTVAISGKFRYSTHVKSP